MKGRNRAERVRQQQPGWAGFVISAIGPFHPDGVQAPRRAFQIGLLHGMFVEQENVFCCRLLVTLVFC